MPDRTSLTQMPIQSLILSPVQGQQVAGHSIRVQGIAWGGGSGNAIERVEVGNKVAWRCAGKVCMPHFHCCARCQQISRHGTRQSSHPAQTSPSPRGMCVCVCIAYYVVLSDASTCWPPGDGCGGSAGCPRPRRRWLCTVAHTTRRAAPSQNGLGTQRDISTTAGTASASRSTRLSDESHTTTF